MHGNNCKFTPRRYLGAQYDALCMGLKDIDSVMETEISDENL
jgi:hypothetical protein